MKTGKFRRGIVESLIVAIFSTLLVMFFVSFVSGSSVFIGKTDKEEPPLISPHSFIYSFNREGVLQESPSPKESSSPYFWLSSGGMLVIERGIGKTINGDLGEKERWKKAYAKKNSLDSDQGKNPQNIFRLVTKSRWGDVDQKIKVYIDHANTTKTPNRGEWSGIFLMSRYDDWNNLYYAGIRMDGLAIIKKKKDGVYYTLGHTRLFGENVPFNRDTNPNLIPEKTWLGIRSITTTNPDSSVTIELFFELENNNSWQRLLSVKDSGEMGGGPFAHVGGVGIRGDYMDLWFENYEVAETRD